MFSEMKCHIYNRWLLPHFCWDVWKERNNCIFRDSEATGRTLLEKIKKNLLENYATNNGGNPMVEGNREIREEEKRQRR